jgi:outer membrane biosynthesis protein TonB
LRIGAESNQPKTLSVSPSVMQRNLINKAEPVYPPKAKKAQGQGTIKIKAVMGKDGALSK